jgi:hypothetical protein
VNVAFAARDVALPSFVRSEIPELGVRAEGAAPSPALPPSPPTPVSTAWDAAVTTGPDAATADAEPPKKAGCLGCALAETQARNGPLALAAALLGIFVLRRRRAT